MDDIIPICRSGIWLESQGTSKEGAKLKEVDFVCLCFVNFSPVATHGHIS
jgi:hypothetical protein